MICTWLQLWIFFLRIGCLANNSQLQFFLPQFWKVARSKIAAKNRGTFWVYWLFCSLASREEDLRNKLDDSSNKQICRRRKKIMKDFMVAMFKTRVQWFLSRGFVKTEIEIAWLKKPSTWTQFHYQVHNLRKQKLARRDLQFQ